MKATHHVMPAVLMLACVVQMATVASPASSAPAATSPLPTGRRLKEIIPLDGPVPFLIGGSINQPALGGAAEVIFNREFAFLTPGNDFKQSMIHPEPGTWRWEKPDAWVRYAGARGYPMRLHGPVGPQCSTWAKDDSRTPEELAVNMDEFMSALCKRYAKEPHVRWMDVVNETVTDKGEWFGPRPGAIKWENPWTAIGFDDAHPLRPPLYIKRAFEIATRHAGSAKLLINQHADMQPAMWEKIKGLVGYLRDAGLRVDGIGWQAHVDSGWEQDPDNLRLLDELIEWCHDSELEFHVTECTVWMKGDGDADALAQAATFAAIVRTVAAHRDRGMVSWNAWQMRDCDLQRPAKRGAMFTDDGAPKPSYYAVQRELESLRHIGP